MVQVPMVQRANAHSVLPSNSQSQHGCPYEDQHRQHGHEEPLRTPNLLDSIFCSAVAFACSLRTRLSSGSFTIKICSQKDVEVHSCYIEISGN